MDGSPPPAWGSPKGQWAGQPLTRFTPTRVGKPLRVDAGTTRQAVHPHPRGEAVNRERSPAPWDGSPPPAWGSRYSAKAAAKLDWFTPTRVGKPAYVCQSPYVVSVHPHPRGEAPSARPTRKMRSGSPPPAWGSRHLSRRCYGMRRFTPTRVGKPSVIKEACIMQSVHPHPRGEAA